MRRDVCSWKRAISISMDEQMVEELDAIRGNVSRSAWVRELLDQAIETQLLHGDRT
jgi:metal-responsive CopG/Arc/MetJ family transcriptional regulator